MWTRSSSEKLDFWEWDDEDVAVVYGALSGDTHLIQRPGLELLQLLTEAPRTSEMLAVELIGLFSDESPSNIVKFIEVTLQHLQNVGLVEDI